jgi:hypothetical protein
LIAIQEHARRIGPTDAGLTIRLHVQSQDEALEAAGGCRESESRCDKFMTAKERFEHSRAA